MQESRNNVENTLKMKEKEVAEELAVLLKKAKVRVACSRGGCWGANACGSCSTWRTR